MATGASNLSGERIDGVLDHWGVPKSSNIAEGYVCVYTSDSGDNKIVDIPTAATALLGGRAFAGISKGQSTTVAYTSTDPPGDQQVPLQLKGVAKCSLKTNTACTRGGEAAYDPIDGGPVVPYTSANQVKIGRFTQTKSSSASIQFVGVELDMGSTAIVARHAGGIVADATNTTNVDTEQTYTDGTQTLKANSFVAGSIIDIEGMVIVTNQNAADTLTIRVKIGSTNILVSTAVDPATSDIAYFKVRAKIRTIGAAGTLVTGGFIMRGAASAAVGSTVLDDTASTAIDTTAAVTVSVSGQWSAASANNVSALRMFDAFVTNPSA